MRISPVLFAAGLLIVAAPGLDPQPARAAVQRPFPVIHVTGEAIVRVTPDIAQATAGVSTEAKTPREAADANARAMRAVVAAIREAGIPDADIRTSRFSLQPVQAARSREAPQVVAYRASNQVTVTIRDAAKVGEVLDQMIAAGATNITGVEFLASDHSKLADAARSAAFADAKRKAELYANAAGAQLGRTVAISEYGAGPPPIPVFRQASPAAAPPPPIAPGEEELRVQISVSFELAQ